MLFVVGVAVGRTSAELSGDDPARTQTLVRTLRPLPLPPQRETVTVTVAQP